MIEIFQLRTPNQTKKQWNYPTTIIQYLGRGTLFHTAAGLTKVCVSLVAVIWSMACPSKKTKALRPVSGSAWCAFDSFGTDILALKSQCPWSTDLPFIVSVPAVRYSTDVTWSEIFQRFWEAGVSLWDYVRQQVFFWPVWVGANWPWKTASSWAKGLRMGTTTCSFWQNWCKLLHRWTQGNPSRQNGKNKIYIYIHIYYYINSYYIIYIWFAKT